MGQTPYLETGLRENRSAPATAPSPAASPRAYLVDVGQRTLTGELHRVHLHGRAGLDDLILIAQGSHVQHEGLSGTNELIVHLAQEQDKTRRGNGSLLSSLFSLSGVPSLVGHSERTPAIFLCFSSSWKNVSSLQTSSNYSRKDNSSSPVRGECHVPGTS